MTLEELRRSYFGPRFPKVNGFYNANLGIWKDLKKSEEMEVKSKQELIEKWESAIEAAEFYGKGKEERLIEYMREFVSDLNQLDEPKITELDALNRLAQNVQFSADEIANHLEKLSAHNEQVTYGNQEILSRDWIDEHRKSYTMEDSVEVSDLQNLLVPKQELPVIPKYVADYIDGRKEVGFPIYQAIRIVRENSRFEHSHLREWLSTNKGQETFARAWLDGYEVEERELTVKGVIEEHIELLKKQEVAVNLEPYYDLWEELKDE